jgi:phenylalanyl-tRNA synthetase beta chain
MKVSYNWLKEYIEGDLESPEKVAESLSLKSFEVEEVLEADEDYVLDVDVLPNRAHDCLCHTGIAKEIALGLGLKFNYPIAAAVGADFDTDYTAEITDKRCKRYMLREITGVKVGPSPEELRKKMEILGENSINNVVDITNIILFELGQPMHAFDRDKLSGKNISARTSKEGEKITTLDGNFVELDEDTCVIADEDPIAIAGVKGGNKAEVKSADASSGVTKEETTSLILESANFNAVDIRKTSRKFGISTESSKRYENDLTPELTEVAMNRATELIQKYCGDDVKVSNVVDIYPEKDEDFTVEFSVENTSRLLGVEISKDEISEILDRYGFEYEGEFKVKIPALRRDLRLEADLIEEVGRIHGYEKIEPAPIEGLEPVKNSDQEAAATMKIKSVLQDLGFSEVQTYSFVEEGDLKAVKALASDKQYLRTSLEKGMTEALELNSYNADLISVDRVQIFEIGKVYPKGKETLVLGLGVRNKNFKKPKTDAILNETLSGLSEKLGTEFKAKISQDQEFVQIELEDLISKIDISEEIKLDFDNEVQFKALSSYPFMTRDVSVWIPNGKGNEETIFEIVEKYAGDLLRTKRLFDVYEKEGRTSYGVRVVFQSNEKTLTDDEAGEIMDKVYKDLESQEGYEIR